MATLPSGGIDLSGGLEYRQFPSRTWNINKETNRIEGETDRLQAVRQAVEVMMNVARFAWQIYRPYSGIQYLDLIGQEPSFAAAELQRRVKEALSMDDRILGISDFTFQEEGDTVTVYFRVNSVYGLTGPVEVSIS